MRGGCRTRHARGLPHAPCEGAAARAMRGGCEHPPARPSVDGKASAEITLEDPAARARTGGEGEGGAASIGDVAGEAEGVDRDMLDRLVDQLHMEEATGVEGCSAEQRWGPECGCSAEQRWGPEFVHPSATQARDFVD
eukprot:gene25627-65798_t